MAVTLPGTGIRVGLVALLLFAPLVEGGTTFVPATVIRLGALALAASWLWVALAPGAAWRQGTAVDVPLMLFMLLAAASTAASDYPYQSLQAFLTLASGVLVFVVAVEVSREPRGAAWIARTVVAGGLAQALLALAQHAAGSAPRAAGTYFNPNHLATALVMTGALLLAAQPASGVLRWTALAACGLVGAALVATGSRGGVLAAAAGWSLVGWCRWRGRAVVAMAAIALVLLMVPNPLGDRLRRLDAHDPFAYTRAQIWASAVERAVENPFGVGLNLFRQSSQRYAFPVEADVARYGRRAESAHNDYLQTLAELGPAGLLLALWGLASLAVAARRAVQGTGGLASSPVTLGAAGALAALAAQALVDTPLHVPGLLVPGAALAGLLTAAGRPAALAASAAMPPLVRPARRRPVRLAVAALGCVAAVGVARHGLAYLAYTRAQAEQVNAGPLAARKWLELAAWLAPDSAAYPDALAASALAAWKQSGHPGHVVAAEQAMLRAIALDPMEARRHARLARVYLEAMPANPGLRRATLDRTLALFEEAERLDPYDATYPFARADLLAQRDDAAGAVTALERAIALEPRLLPARLRLARLLVARGERAAAAAQYAAIEATLAAYEERPVQGPLAEQFLAVDRSAVRREAAALKEDLS